MEVVNEVCLVLQGLHTNDKIMEKFPYLEEKNNGKKILKNYKWCQIQRGMSSF